MKRAYIILTLVIIAILIPGVSATLGYNWTTGDSSQSPDQRYGAAVVYWKNATWVFAGTNVSSASTPPFQDSWKSTDGGVTWTLMNGSCGYGVRAFPSVWYNSTDLWMGFGRVTSAATAMNDIWHTSDGIHWDQVTSNSGADKVHDAAPYVYNGYAYNGGGMGTSGAQLSTLWKAPLSNMSNWSEVNATAGFGATEGMGTAVVGNMVYLIDGLGAGSSYKASVYTASDGEKFSLNYTPPWSARYTPIVFTGDGKIWHLGGTDNTNYYGDVEYTADGINWVKLLSNSTQTYRYYGQGTFDGTNITLATGYQGAVGFSPAAYSTGTSGLYSSAWADTNYNNRAAVEVIAYPSGGTQMGVYVPYIPGAMQTSMQDVRFYTTGGTLLNHWKEKTVASSYALDWSNVPPGTSEVMMYYNNSSASDTSNGTNTFPFFEDWSSNSLNTSKWVNGGNAPSFSGGIMSIVGSGSAYSHVDSLTQFNSSYHVRMNTSMDYDTYGNEITGFGSGITGSSVGKVAGLLSQSSPNLAAAFKDTSLDYTNTPVSGYALTDVYRGSPSYIYVNGVLVKTSSTQNPTADINISFASYASGKYVKNDFVFASMANPTQTYYLNTGQAISNTNPPVASFTTNTSAGLYPLPVAFTDTSTNTPTSWSWNFGGLGTSTSQNPTFTFTTGGNFSVTLNATNAYGSNTTTGYINVYNITNTSFTQNVTSGSRPLTVSFTDTSTNTTPTPAYYWMFGDGNTSTSQNPVHTYSSIGTYTVNHSASNGYSTNWSNQTNLINVTSVPDPNPTSQLRYKNVVSSSQINNQTPYVGTVRASNITSNTTWVTINATWDPTYFAVSNIRLNNTDISGTTLVSSSISSGYFTANISKASGMTLSLSSLIDFNITMVKYAAPGTGAVFNFTSSGSSYYDPANSTSWSFDQFRQATAYTGTWGPITANFTGTPTTVSTGSSVTFTDASTGYPDAWSWNFGDGNTSTSQNPVHTYYTSGTYTINETAYMSENSSVTNTLSRASYISVVAAPVANFTGTPLSGTAPLSVTFTDSSTNTPTSWLWNFGDGNTSTLQNPSHTYSISGVYSVNLTATNTYGSSYLNRTSYVSVGTAPVANFTGTPLSGTAPLSVAFTDSSSGSPTSWHWDFGDGYIATTQNPTHIYNTSGVYSVNLTATNAYGSGYLLKSSYITAGNIPVVNFTGTPTSGYAPLNVTFTDYSTNAPTSWNWSFGDGSYNTSQNVTHTYAAAGTYSVNLTATNAYGGGYQLRSSYINASATPVPVASFIASPNPSTINSTVAFTDTSTNTPTSWSWNFGDGNTSTLQNPTHAFTAAGNFTVSLNATNAYGSNTTTSTQAVYSAAGFNRQDLYMAPEYTLVLTIKDTDGNVIPVVNVTDSDGNSFTTTNGIYTHTYPYEVVAIYLSASGYATKSVTYVMYKDRVESTTMTAASSTVQNNNVVYYPTQVEFILYTASGNPLSNALIEATPLNFTAPDNWTQLLLGINSQVNITGTTVSGYTGTDGTWAAPMLASNQYSVEISGTYNSAAYDYTIELYPAVSPVQLTIPIGITAIPTSAAGVITYSLNNTSINSTAQYVTMRYADTSASTSTLIFWVVNATGATVISTTYTGSAANSETFNQTFPVVMGQSYTYGFSADTSNFEDPWINQSQSININYQIGLLGQSPGKVELWLAIAILVMWAAIGSIFFKHVVLIGEPILYWFIAQYFGWLPLTAQVYIVLGVMLTLGGLIYIRYKENQIV